VLALGRASPPEYVAEQASRLPARRQPTAGMGGGNRSAHACPCSPKPTWTPGPSSACAWPTPTP